MKERHREAAMAPFFKGHQFDDSWFCSRLDDGL
jgi:hypothetical protein